MDRIGHWVGGRAVAGGSGRTTPVFDPARGVQTGEVALAAAAEVGDFVKVAVGASAAWGASASSHRAGMLFRLRELIDAHRDELAAIVTRSMARCSKTRGVRSPAASSASSSRAVCLIS